MKGGGHGDVSVVVVAQHGESGECGIQMRIGEGLELGVFVVGSFASATGIGDVSAEDKEIGLGGEGGEFSEGELEIGGVVNAGGVDTQGAIAVRPRGMDVKIAEPRDEHGAGSGIGNGLLDGGGKRGCGLAGEVEF